MVVFCTESLWCSPKRWQLPHWHHSGFLLIKQGSKETRWCVVRRTFKHKRFSSTEQFTPATADFKHVFRCTQWLFFACLKTTSTAVCLLFLLTGFPLSEQNADASHLQLISRDQQHDYTLEETALETSGNTKTTFMHKTVLNIDTELNNMYWNTEIFHCIIRLVGKMWWNGKQLEDQVFV